MDINLSSKTNLLVDLNYKPLIEKLMKQMVCLVQFNLSNSISVQEPFYSPPLPRTAHSHLIKHRRAGGIRSIDSIGSSILVCLDQLKHWFQPTPDIMLLYIYQSLVPGEHLYHWLLIDL